VLLSAIAALAWARALPRRARIARCGWLFVCLADMAFIPDRVEFVPLRKASRQGRPIVATH